MTYQDKISRQLSGFSIILGWIVATLMALLVLDVWLAVLDRYVLHLQIIWTEALARYIMMWAIFLSMPIIIVRRENIALTFLNDKLPPRMQIIARIIVDIISTLFYGFVAFYGISFAESGKNAISAFFDYPMSWAYYSIPVSFTLMTVVSLVVVVSDVLRYVGGDNEKQGV